MSRPKPRKAAAARPKGEIRVEAAEPHVLPDVAAIMRENAELRREVSRLRGEVAVMAMKLEPQC